MSELDDVLERLKGVNALLEGIPEGAEVFRKVRSNLLSAEEATLQLMAIAAQHGLLETLTSASEEIRSLVPAFSGDLEGEDGADRPISMETSTGISQLNPLFEAALAERAFFDGDVPEFRRGRIPLGGHPAVPVVTESLDPIVVGEMLHRASTEVEREIHLAVVQRDEICERLMAMADQENQVALEVTKRNLPLVPTGVKGYLAGRTPELRVVQAPTVAELEALTYGERAQRALSSILTTQGRVSLAPAIEKELRKRLSGRVLVHEGSYPSNDLEKREFDWAAEIFGREFNEKYHPASSAVAYFASKIESAVADGFPVPEDGISLKVIPLNMIAERRFGWSVRMGLRKR